MTARLVKPAISFVAVGAVILAALAVYLSLGSGNADADSVYTPRYFTHYCNSMDPAFPDPALAGLGHNPVTFAPNCSENKQTSASPAVTTILDQDAADMNFSSVATFASGAGTITDGDTIPAGTTLGGLRSLTNLGLLNATCTTALVVDFILYNVALPDNPGSPRSSSNIVYPRPDGTANRFSHWNVGSEPLATGGTAVTDADANLRGDSSTLAIQNYPKYLLDVFDPDFVPGVSDGPANPIVPQAVYGGLTNVANTWVPLFFAQFNPGQLTGMSGAMSEFATAMGAPNVSVLNDPSAVVVSPSSITDFCTPLNVTTVLLGTSGVHTRATSPSTAGTHFNVQYNASQRDTDQDGLENQVDTCPGNVNTGADADNDGIDNACDTGGGGSDQDGDGFQNRQDNCPQVANPGTAQTDSEVGTPAADLGPRLDGIGDACDTGTVNATINNRPITFTMSATVGNGRYHSTLSHDATCFGAAPAGGPDVDADGYCDGAAQDNQSSGACAPNCHVRHTAWNAAYANALMSGLDTDNDTWSDAQETYFGTEQTKACQESTLVSNEAPLDNWPMDFNDSGNANSIDVGTFVSRLNRAVNQAPAAPRWDLNFDGFINSVDVGRFVAVFNKTCAVGQANTLGYPTYASQTQ